MAVLAVLGSISFVTAASAGSAANPEKEALYAGFVEPAMEYGPRTWWHWGKEWILKFIG